jgi:hypothetical protein
MSTLRIFGALCLLFLLVSAAPAAAIIYTIDDGTGEDALTRTGAGPLIWANHFDRVSGGEVVGAISAAFGFFPADAATMNGTPLVASLWSDPNGDGIPSDATLLASVGGFTANWATDVFNTYDIPDTAVGPSFFAAISLYDPGWSFPARMDTSTLGYESWAGLGSDLSGMSRNSDSLWWNFMVRADTADPVPEPGTILLVGGALLGLAARRLRARQSR